MNATHSERWDHSAASALFAVAIAATTVACTASAVEPLSGQGEAALVAPAGVFKFVSCNSDALCARGQSSRFCDEEQALYWQRN
jgi:hypothetical protein